MLNKYLNVIVDNFKKRASAGGNRIHDFTKSGVTEGGRDTARVDCAHGVVQTILGVMLYSTLHGDTTVKDDIDESGNVEDISDRCEGGVFAKRVPSKSTVLLDEAFHAHVLECSLLRHDECDLSKLSGEEKTIRMAERILGSANVYVGKERKGLDTSILVHVVGVIIEWLLDLTRSRLGTDTLVIRNETAEFSWSKVGDMADDEILNKLCKPEVLEHVERQGGTRRGRLRVKGDVRDGV